MIVSSVERRGERREKVVRPRSKIGAGSFLDRFLMKRSEPPPRLSLLIFEPVRSTDHPPVCPAATFARGASPSMTHCVYGEPRLITSHYSRGSASTIHDEKRNERNTRAGKFIRDACCTVVIVAQRGDGGKLYFVGVCFVLFFFSFLFFFFFFFFRTKDLRFSSFLRWKPYGSAASRDDRLEIVFFGSDNLIEKNFEKRKRKSRMEKITQSEESNRL